MAEQKQQITETIYKNYSYNTNLLIRDTKLVIFVAKNNESFSICNEFSKMVCDMPPVSQLAKQYKAG